MFPAAFDVTFSRQIISLFSKLQAVIVRSNFKGFPKSFCLLKNKNVRQTKRHVQNNANQQKSKLALQNNIVTSHDAHDSFWMTEATSESFARFTGRK